MADHSFDAIVLGAGPAGVVAAGRCAERGLKVALVESELVGGECSFWACMPSKALLRPAVAVDEARRVPGAGEAASLDVGAALRRRDAVIHDLSDDVQLPWIEKRGISLFRGYGRLDGERRVRVGSDRLTARRAVFLATGSRAAMPPIPGLADVGAWDNRKGTTAKEVPASLLILGGGVVGVELAQAWSSLGARVTLVEAVDRLLVNEEPFAGEEVAESLRARGVDLRLGAKAAAARLQDGRRVLELEGGDTVAGDELMVAVGRSPRTQDIGLETVGLKGGGWVEVDDRMRVPGQDWLYAVGDVNARVLLTHMGKYQARVAVDVMCGRDVRVQEDGLSSPRVVFTEPQVAAVGLTLARAREQGLQVRALDKPSGATAGASFHGRNAVGTSRLIVDEERRVLVGATFTGVDVDEWLHAATVAIVGRVPLERLWHAVPAFPTRSEVWLKLLEDLD